MSRKAYSPVYLFASISLLGLAGCAYDPYYPPATSAYVYEPEPQIVYHDYYYYPDVQVYFHISSGDYWYYSGQHWVHTRHLPAHIHLHGHKRVRMSAPQGRPYFKHPQYRDQYREPQPHRDRHAGHGRERREYPHDGYRPPVPGIKQRYVEEQIQPAYPVTRDASRRNRAYEQPVRKPEQRDRSSAPAPRHKREQARGNDESRSPPRQDRGRDSQQKQFHPEPAFQARERTSDKGAWPQSIKRHFRQE